MISNLLTGVQRKSKAADPIYMQIEPTSMCNLDCTMCFRKDLPYDLEKHMSLEKFKEVLAKFPKLKIINLTGFGEPLLNPDLIPMVEYASKKGIKVETITNGTIFTEDRARDLFRAGLDKLTISIDGAEESYDKVRGIKNSRVMGSLRTAVKVKKELGVKTQIFVNTVILPDNIEDLEALGKSLPSDIVWNLKTIRPNKNYEQYHDDDKIAEIMKANKHISKIDYTKYKQTPYCFRIQFGAYVNFDGEMYPCCNLFNGHEMGNVLEEDAWNSEKFVSFREEFKHRWPEACKVCNLTFNQKVYKYAKWIGNFDYIPLLEKEKELVQIKK